MFDSLKWKLQMWNNKKTTNGRLDEIEKDIAMLSNGIFRPKLEIIDYAVNCKNISWQVMGVTDCSGCGCLIRCAVAVRDGDYYCKRCRP